MMLSKLMLGRGILEDVTRVSVQYGRCNGFPRKHQVVHWSSRTKSQLLHLRSVAVSAAESTQKSKIVETEAVIHNHISAEQQRVSGPTVPKKPSSMLPNSVDEHASQGTQPTLLDLGKVTNTLLDRVISDYRILEKESRLLLGAFEKIVLTQSYPTQLLNDSRFRLLFVTLVRRANQLSAEEFYEMFSIMLHCDMLHSECTSDFRALRKLCVQVAFHLATLNANRISLPAQVDIAYTLKMHEASLRREVDALYDAFAYQLQLLIADRRDQFSKLKFDELAYVVALFSCSPRKQPSESERGKSGSKDAVGTGELWTQIVKDASRRLGKALSMSIGDETVKDMGAMTPTYEQAVEALHAFAFSGVQNEPIVKACIKFVQQHDEPLESRLAALRPQRHVQFMQLTRKFEVPAAHDCDASHLDPLWDSDSSSLAQVETTAYLEKWKRERLKLLDTLLSMPVGGTLSRLSLMERVECDLLRNPQLTLMDCVGLLETYFKHNLCIESSALARGVLEQLAVGKPDKNLFKRALRVVLLHSDWSFLLADARTLQSFLDGILSLGTVDADFGEHTLRFSSLCRLKELLDEATNRPSDTFAKLNDALTVGDVLRFLECASRHIASVPTSPDANDSNIDELRQNELVAAGLLYCNRQGLLTSGNDALERCLAAFARRNASLGRLIPQRAALLESIAQTMRSFPIERLDLPATAASASSPQSESKSMYTIAKAPLHFADMFVTFSAQQISIGKQCTGLDVNKAESEPQKNATSNVVEIGCPRVAIQVLDDRSYLRNVSKCIYPKRVLLDTLRAACAPDWRLIRITEAEWRACEFWLSGKPNLSITDDAKRSYILHLLRLSS